MLVRLSRLSGEQRWRWQHPFRPAGVVVTGCRRRGHQPSHLRERAERSSANPKPVPHITGDRLSPAYTANPAATGRASGDQVCARAKTGWRRRHSCRSANRAPISRRAGARSKLAESVRLDRWGRGPPHRASGHNLLRSCPRSPCNRLGALAENPVHKVPGQPKSRRCCQQHRR